jgi:hypothetical protein
MEDTISKKTRGRKKLDTPRLQKVTFSLEPDLLNFYKVIGNGKVINGLRNCFLLINKNKSLLEKSKAQNCKQLKAKDFDKILKSFSEELLG